ncbi:MAG TPA: tail fiber protein [Thermoanaerobaculia bacterium]|nr:tail fiber protein [Thermoanaerobaculia bacterium]
MAEPFLSEIRIFSFNFPPKGWAFCNGQILPINQNQALFSLLGTTYGGNGQTTFALPNLQGRAQLHFGNGHLLGESAGASAVTITQQTMPQHTHLLNGTTNAGNQPTVANAVPAALGLPMYSNAVSNLAAFSASSVTSVGGGQPHTNMQPYLVLNFCIALQGIFPSRS